MDHRTTDPTTEPRMNPVFSIAGATPGTPNTGWKTAYPNPDATIVTNTHVGRGPCFSIAGVMPGRPETAWRTAMPDPSRDVLDSLGHVISRVEAELRAHARAELSPRRPGVLTVRASA